MTQNIIDKNFDYKCFRVRAEGYTVIFLNYEDALESYNKSGSAVLFGIDSKNVEYLLLRK